jgi:hypothetical protein
LFAVILGKASFFFFWLRVVLLLGGGGLGSVHGSLGGCFVLVCLLLCSAAFMVVLWCVYIALSALQAEGAINF